MAHSLITLEDPKSQISEAYRALRTNVQFNLLNSETNRIMITSAGRKEGKSFTVANLAVSMAQDGKFVLVVDADLRNPTQHKLFGIDNSEGLSTDLAEAQDYKKFIQFTPIPGVMVLPAGPIPSNPAELIGSERMKYLVNDVGQHFDIVLFDTPPVIAVADAVILAQNTDWVILVLDSMEENISYLKHAKDLLAKVNAKFLGAVLNKVELNDSKYYYYDYCEEDSYVGEGKERYHYKAG